MQYLRTDTYPLYWNNALKEFDFNKYVALQSLASYLVIDDLVAWIRDQKYLGAVQKEYIRQTFIRPTDTESVVHRLTPANTTFSTKTVLTTEREYFCPRARNAHKRDDIEECKEKCWPKMYRDGITVAPGMDYRAARTTETREEIRLNLEVCKVGYVAPRSS